MVVLALSVAVCLWALAALFVHTRDRPFPQFTNLRLLEEWQRRCSNLHHKAQRGLRTLFATFAIVGTLVGGVLATFPRHGILSSGDVTALSAGVVLFAIATVAAGPRLAERWEHTARLHLRDWLNGAEIARYKVKPLPPAPKQP